MDKKKDRVEIVYTKIVEDCEECDHSDYDNGKFVCCADKLPRRYITREIEDERLIPKWCPYRKNNRR